MLYFKYIQKTLNLFLQLVEPGSESLEECALGMDYWEQVISGTSSVYSQHKGLIVGSFSFFFQNKPLSFQLFLKASIRGKSILGHLWYWLVSLQQVWLLVFSGHLLEQHGNLRIWRLPVTKQGKKHKQLWIYVKSLGKIDLMPKNSPLSRLLCLKQYEKRSTCWMQKQLK